MHPVTLNEVKGLKLFDKPYPDTSGFVKTQNDIYIYLPSLASSNLYSYA